MRNNLDFIHNGRKHQLVYERITGYYRRTVSDHHTAVHQNQPNCESYQNYKGVFKDKANGVFNGKVL